MGLGLAIGEVLIKAALHTDQDLQDGEVTITVQRSGQNGIVQVKGAAVEWPAGTSGRTGDLSLRLLQAYAQQAGAALSQEPGDKGARLQLIFPLPKIATAAA
jgi:two-component sensor histidine kinase